MGSAGLLLGVLAAKLVALALTVTSGWRGGFIIPLFFVAATLGKLIRTIFPAQSLPLAMISCVATLNACATRTPIGTAMLLATLTGFQQAGTDSVCPPHRLFPSPQNAPPQGPAGYTGH